MDTNKPLIDWESRTKGLSIADALKTVNRAFGSSAVLTTSFGKEDQYITHLIATNALDISIATLDTGRLFEETLDLFNRTRSRYDIHIEVFCPDTKALAELITKKGPNSFYLSVEDRKECCYVRKVEPLQRCLKNKAVWVTGIRADQSANRRNMPQWEYDESNQIFKFHPLLHISDQELDELLASGNIPVNELHDRGYPSIGCAPCTRAVEDGEHPRAGRWWWETSSKECGLHSTTVKAH